jgi:LPS-assembly lipoprotein
MAFGARAVRQSTKDMRASGATTRRALLAALATVALAGCGFKLRASSRLPFETIYLGFGPNSSVGTELARNIRSGTGTRVVETSAEAQAIFELLSESRERDILSFNAQGQVREIELRVRVSFRVHDGKGRDFIAPTSLLSTRSVAYDEQQALAGEAQEALLYRDMQTDLVQQVLRRMAAAKV